MIIGIVIAVIVVLILAVIVMYNGLVKARINCDEAFSTMDVYLKKRFDLIPNLVETVKGYAKHEAETLEKVIEKRNQATASGSADAVSAAENQITGALRQIFALSESYPDLKANSNFQELMEQLQSVEEDIAEARKYYNAVVKEYNTKLITVPSNIIAGMFHFESREMFLVDDSSERKNVKVNF